MLLPSVQLDHVVEDLPPQPFIANRNPQPGEAQVPPNFDIEFDFIQPDTDRPSDDEFTVSVDGVVVLADGEFQNGRTGWIINGFDAATVRFGIRDNTFESGREILVTVQGPFGFNESWSFVSYDLLPPLLAGVVALNKDQVRVTFTEPVMMINPVIAGDALNPESYLIERVSRPAATPGIVSVERIDETRVLLTTAFELSFGAQYLLVVTGVSDEFDNVFLAPDNVAAFSGWLPPFPAGRRFLLHDFVPAFSLAEDATDELRLFLGCLQDTTNLLLHLVDKWVEILDPDLAPEAFVDAMLDDLGNPFTFELPTVDVKRKLVKVLVRIYQLKGTVLGIVDVVRFFLGIEVTIEVFNGQGWRLGYDKLSSITQVATPNPAIIGAGGRALYSFRVRTTEILSAEQREQITIIATYMKGAHEHLVGVQDGGVPVPSWRYWQVGITRIGYARIAMA